MAVIETWLEQDLQSPVKVRYIDGSLFSNNGNGNRIGVRVFNNGDPVTLTGTVSGYVIVADGSTVPCTGSRSENEASILIPPAAYQPGAVLISIFLTDGSTVTTLAAIATTVMQARTNNQVSPGSVVQDWTQTINEAMQAVEDASAEQDVKIDDLRGELNNESVKGCSSESITSITWQQGRIGNSGGVISGANAPNYCISSVLRNSSDAKRIDCAIKTGWEFYITEHTSSSLGTGTYVRHYPKDKNPTQDPILIYPVTGHRYTVNIKKTDGSNFTPSQVPSDVITITVWRPTDKTLTLSDVAADAKAVGDFKGISFLSDYSSTTQITSGDLDDYITPGTYAIPANSYIPNIDNLPVEATGMLYVIKMASEAIYQLYMAYTADGGSIYVRNKSSVSWREWVKFSTMEEVEHAFLTDYSKITRITSGDLDDYITPGTYTIPANVYTADIDNMPVKAVGMLYVIKMASASIYQLYMAYTDDGGSMYVRNKSSSAWRSWVKFSTIGDQKSRYNGKRVSIIGDSIETYAGYVVPGYRTSYPSLGVNSVEQTWWMQVINNTGAALEVNAAFTGSMVTNNRQGDEYADHYPDLYERVSVIGSPDIVFITLGTNDSNYDVALGEYDFETAYTSLSESTFRTAYIKGIKAIRATYPDAEIVCVSEYMHEEYRDSIEHIAKELGVKYINAYDYNRQSGSHPGVLGMQQIASLVLFPTDSFLWQKHYPADAQATGLKISALEGKVPDAPASDGSYTLKATVSGGTVSYFWESTN